MGEVQRNTNKTENNLTSDNVFSLRISPDFMRAASATQSAAVTPQLPAYIFSLSTSNSLLPNFTLAMESRGCSCWACAAPQKNPRKMRVCRYRCSRLCRRLCSSRYRSFHPFPPPPPPPCLPYSSSCNAAAGHPFFPPPLFLFTGQRFCT
jgi:hypothetical protein